MPVVDIDIKKIKDLNKALEADIAGSNLLIVENDGQGETKRVDEQPLADALSKKMRVSNIDNDKNYQTNTQVTASITSHNAATDAHADIRSGLSEVEAIARGKARSMVFDTVADLDAWLAVQDNVDTLEVGDNFYIKAIDVPDYWWDGTQKQMLETEKVDLTGIYTKVESNSIFSKKSVVKEFTIPVASWVADGTLRKATITDADVIDGSIIRAYPVISSEEVSSLAGIYSEVTSSAAGSFILTSDLVPSADITIKYIISM